jgi:hypothetical protein
MITDRIIIITSGSDTIGIAHDCSLGCSKMVTVTTNMLEVLPYNFTSSETEHVIKNSLP